MSCILASLLHEKNEKKVKDPVVNVNQYFIVEAIKGKRYYQNMLQYLVKWEGYSDVHNSWEPVKMLKNVRSLIEEFELKLTDKM